MHLAEVQAVNEDNTITCLHFKRLIIEGVRSKWVRPSIDDIQDVLEVQIIPVIVDAEWDLGLHRHD